MEGIADRAERTPADMRREAALRMADGFAALRAAVSMTRNSAMFEDGHASRPPSNRAGESTRAP